jgi:hypothetical protein
VAFLRDAELPMFELTIDDLRLTNTTTRLSCLFKRQSKIVNF